MIRQFCPACGEPICPPMGKSQELLIIGDAPNQVDMTNGKPFATHYKFNTQGHVLRKELQEYGVSLMDFRVTYLWLHEPTKQENCWQAGYNHVLDEAKGKKAILLVGSDTVSTFTTYNVSDVNGLQVDSNVLSAPIIYALINPLYRGLGEVRFGIQKFVERLQKEGLI